MKNIIKFFKTILNNRGEISNNVMTGLSVGVFAAVVGYSVYNAYNNSPAYNPANRAIYTGEGLNLGADSFDGNRLDLQTPETLPGVVYSGRQGDFNKANTTKNDIAKEQASFDAARAYLDSQRSGVNQADGAYGPRGETDAYSNGDVYNPFGTTYETGVSGLVEPGSRSGGSGYTEQQFQAAQQAAAAAAGGAKGKGDKTGTPAARQATQVAKLAASSGGSSFGSGAKGGSSLSGGNSGASSGGVSSSGKDNNTRALPQTAAGQTAGSTGAFKAGRSGGLGGFNVAAGKNGGTGAEQGGAKGGSRGGNAKAELNMAYNFSSKAVATLQSEGEKGLAQSAQEAANAFDGGATGDDSGPNIDGKIPRNMSSNKLGGLMGRGNLGLDTVQADFEDHGTKKNRLTNCVKSHLTWALVATLIACIAIGFILQTKAWYTYVIAALVAIAALYSIWFMDYDGDGLSIAETLSELMALRAEDGQSNNAWLSYAAMGLMSGAVLSSFIWGPKVVSWFKGFVSNKVFGFIGKMFGLGAANQVKDATVDVIDQK